MIVNDICKVCDGRCCLGCKNLKDDQCSLTYDERPINCRLYPFVWANGDLLLSPTCPGMMLFWEKYPEAKEMADKWIHV